MPSGDAKTVKKEEAEEKSLSCMVESRNNRPTNGKVKKEVPEDEDDDYQKPLRKSTSASKIKKERNAIDDDDRKPLPKRNSSASTAPDNKEVKKNAKSNVEENKVDSEQNGKKKKERKVYDMPGQKRDPPEERDPLRIFYETLYRQVPQSEMAQFWMMEAGLLPFDEAKKVFEKKQKKNKLTSPTKATSTVKRTAESVTVKKKPTSSPVSSNGKKSTDSKSAVPQSKKFKVDDGSSEYVSDDDFAIKKVAKKPKAK